MEDKTNAGAPEKPVEDPQAQKPDEKVTESTKNEPKILKIAQEPKSETPSSKFRSSDGSYLQKKGEKIDHSPIKKDFEAAEILDYADDNRDQQVVFTCEHSSNKLPPGFEWSAKDARLEKMHWAMDIGALDLAKDLAAHFKSYLLYAKADADKIPIDLNEGLTQDSKLQRMSKFYIPFYQGLKELVNKVKYSLVFSIHSFTKKEDPEIKDLDIGILHNSFDELAEKLKVEFISRGYKAVINEPYDGKQGGNHSQNNSIGYDVDPTRQGILLEYRNDLLTDPVTRAKALKDTIEIIEKLLDEKKPKGASKPLKSAKAAQPDQESVEALLQHAVSKLETDNTQVYYFNKERTTRVAFIAEHAGDKLPEGYAWSQRDQELIVKAGLHTDKNTKELALRLAHRFETAYIGSTVSKLFIDLNSQLTCREIFPLKIGGLVPVQLNESLTAEEEDRRYQQYFVGFLKGVLDLHQNLSAHFWFSIQSFNSLFWPETDIILSNYANDDLVEKTAKHLVKKGYSVKVNPPGFSGKQLFGYVNTTFLNAYYPRKRESIMFLVSSHLLDRKLPVVFEDLSDLIRTKYLKQDDEKKAKKA